LALGLQRFTPVAAEHVLRWVVCPDSGAERHGNRCSDGLGVTISVGLADSLNPSTVACPVHRDMTTARWPVTQFTIGVFGVSLVGGLVLTIGPGRLLLGLVAHPTGTVRHVIELVAGIVLLITAVATLFGRRSLARRELPGRGGGGSSPFVAGASIAAIELPTSAPYFAMIAGIVASSASVPQEIGLLLLYNLVFVAPLLAIAAVMLCAGRRADRWLQAGGAWLQRRWPVVLASLLMFVGSVLSVLGGTGLVKQ
jgi:cytochrome c biogenesis protein CcdA